MKKIRFILVSALSALTLASCSLFNDNDIKIENHFKDKEAASQETPPEATAGGVGSTTITIGTTETLVFKNVIYSNKEEDGVKKIKNTYKKAAPYNFKFDINGAEDYVVNKENNNFDMYVPKGLDKSQDQTVALFIHGGAWVSGMKTHVNPYIKEFAKRGYISVTPEYTLLNRDFNNKRTDSSVFPLTKRIRICCSAGRLCTMRNVAENTLT